MSTLEVSSSLRGWTNCTLKEVVSLQRGHDLTDAQRHPGDVPVMSAAGQNGFHDTAIVRGPGVVVGRSGASIGRVHYCKTDFWPHNTALYVTDFHGNVPLFTFYFLRRLHLSRYNSGGAQPSLNRNFIYPLDVTIPQPKEQQTIAAALSDVDGLIGALDKLIAKKRAIKQAAMQQLLTGKTRLPGFSGEWKSTSLGDIASVSKGSGLSKSVVGESGSRKCVLYGELFTTYGSRIDEVFSRTDSEDGRPSHVGDILMPGSTTTVGADLAKAFALLDDGVAIGGDINIIRPHSSDRVCSAFLADYLTEVKKAEITARTQGITIIHLYGRDLLDLELELPPFPEQTAIATVLSDMDAEIAALERRPDKTKQFKQGMMQSLLTGRVRLLDPPEAKAKV